MTGASGRQRVHNSFFENYEVIQPSVKILEQYSSLVSLWFEEINNLFITTVVLRKNRDLLISQLITEKKTLKNITNNVEAM